MENAKKILVIDDEKDLMELIAFQFSAKGFNVQTAGDGIEALAKVHSFEPDLIILDINMPRMGGIEFFSKICSSSGKSLYPVLILTARANIKDLFQELYIDGFMVKPFEIDHLIAEAEVIIKRRSEDATKTRQKIAAKTHKICIASAEADEFNVLTSQFLNSGYTVIPAKTGAQTIERIMKDVPEVALISLGLPDVAGDAVIHRLSQMAKTMDVKFILFTPRTGEHNHEVLERIKTKKGILTFVEYADPDELLEAVNHVFEL